MNILGERSILLFFAFYSRWLVLYTYMQVVGIYDYHI